MSTTVYVEGGGRGKDLPPRCREGLRNFLGGLDELTGCMPKIVACGSRARAFEYFCTAITSDPNGSHILLVDSEEIVAKSPWEHVRDREGDGWERPEKANDDHIQFMAVCMESWLIADPDSLAKFYGQGFRKQGLPKAKDLEKVEKVDIFKALSAATKSTTKGEYAKGKVSFAALGAVSVKHVRSRMSHCDRFVAKLLELTSNET